MAYCSNCGTELNENAPVCVNCGAVQGEPMNQSFADPMAGQAVQEEDNGGFLWGLLGFFIPLVGLIMFLVWKDTKPKSAKALGIGALVSVIVSIVLVVVIWVGMMALIMSGAMY